jgi:hypothetical protein
LKVLGRPRTGWRVVTDPRKSIRCGLGRYIGTFRHFIKIAPRTMLVRFRRVKHGGRRIVME